MILEALLFSAVHSLIVSVLILLSYKHQPRIWLHQYPKEMQDRVAAKTDAEKQLTRLWGIPIGVCLYLLPLIMVLVRHQFNHFGYTDAFLYLWIMALTFNLVDLLILDWLISVYWRPTWMQLKGAESMQHMENYGFHFKGFVHGLWLATLFAAVAALPFLWL